jgi:hypothetical protein
MVKLRELNDFLRVYGFVIDVMQDPQTVQNRPECISLKAAVMAARIEARASWRHTLSLCIGFGVERDHSLSFK